MLLDKDDANTVVDKVEPFAGQVGPGVGRD